MIGPLWFKSTLSGHAFEYDVELDVDDAKLPLESGFCSGGGGYEAVGGVTKAKGVLDTLGLVTLTAAGTGTLTALVCTALYG